MKNSALGIARSLSVVTAICMIGFSGCDGNDVVTVDGNVTFEGEPVTGGKIIFEPADGIGSTVGGRIEQGIYSVVGPTVISPGAKIVRITAIRKTGRRIAAGNPAPPGTMVDEVESYIPVIYNRSSTLRCVIVADEENSHDFILTSP